VRLQGLIPAVLCGLAACGGGVSGTGGPTSATTPTTASAATDGSPADSSAARYHPIDRAAFGPLWGSGCPGDGACGCGGATNLADEFTCQVDQLAVNQIPITAYLFDGHSWSKGESDSTNTCVGPDCCSWNLGDGVIARLGQGGIRGLLHFWGGCHDDEQYARVSSQLGHNLLGFYLDDGSSDDDLARVSEFMQSADPGDWECVAKAYQNREPSTSDAGLSKWANAAYVGDLPYGFDGLKEAVTRIQAKAPFIPAPFAELTGYAYQDGGIPDEDVYYRRLHFGALQPVMAHTPYTNADPWRREYGPDLVSTYRYWAWLHTELVPYFYSYAYGMYEDPSQPLLRPTPMPYALRAGDELYAPIVTERTDTMDIQLPSGQWIDYWNESSVVSGVLPAFPVPRGREPIFILSGSIIPMDVRNAQTGHGTTESAGSLTVLVYPSGSSSFRYRADALTPWITFTSTLDGNRLTLAADPGLPAQPVVYRIGRWAEAPDSVGIDGATVTVNQGGSVPRLPTEASVDGSRASAWFYDDSARRLIVKVVP
jgi:Glycosyl hydrolase family 31 C-terminal domain